MHYARLLAHSLLLFPLVATAADINKGYTFSPGEHNITHTKLNNLLDLATINSTFYTGKSAATVDGADSFLFYSSSAGDLRKATWNSILLQNTNLITSQTEDTSPATNDLILTYDVSASAYKKVTVGTIWSNSVPGILASNAAIAAYTNAASLITSNLPPTPASNGLALLITSLSNGVPYQIGPSNLGAFNQFFVSTNAPMTNAAGAIMNQAHNLGLVPRTVSFVAQCTNANGIAGYAAGDEVPLGDFIGASDGAAFFSMGVNATNVFVVRRTATTPKLYNKSSGAPADADTTNWLVRVYARP